MRTAIEVISVASFHNQISTNSSKFLRSSVSVCGHHEFNPSPIADKEVMEYETEKTSLRSLCDKISLDS